MPLLAPPMKVKVVGSPASPNAGAAAPDWMELTERQLNFEPQPTVLVHLLLLRQQQQQPQQQLSSSRTYDRPIIWPFLRLSSTSALGAGWLPGFGRHQTTSLVVSRRFISFRFVPSLRMPMAKLAAIQLLASGEFLRRLRAHRRRLAENSADRSRNLTRSAAGWLAGQRDAAANGFRRRAAICFARPSRACRFLARNETQFTE